MLPCGFKKMLLCSKQFLNYWACFAEKVMFCQKNRYYIGGKSQKLHLPPWQINKQKKNKKLRLVTTSLSLDLTSSHFKTGFSPSFLCFTLRHSNMQWQHFFPYKNKNVMWLWSCNLLIGACYRTDLLWMHHGHTPSLAGLKSFIIKTATWNSLLSYWG